MNLQPNHLSNHLIRLEPLLPIHFDELYAAASEPLIWEQHPNPNRYQKEVFESFFEGALESGGAFIVRDVDTGKALGSTRFYDYKPFEKELKLATLFSLETAGDRASISK